MGKQIPYFDTEVAAGKSQAAIMNLLDNTGFDSIAQVKSGGRTVIIAGWRFLYFHVKHVCDAIRMNLMSISEGFAGFLRLPAPGGGSMTMANYIAQAEADGTLATPGFTGRLLLEK